jgi:hypothetical protein
LAGSAQSASMLPMSFDDVLTVIITGLVYSGVGALLVGIALLTFYAILHAWRSDRIGWVIVLTLCSLRAA